MGVPAGRFWRRAIIHVDMDAFFAAVELKDRPELAGRPVVVGARPEDRGVVAAASYEARRFGIHSAMPMARAVRLCPDLVILPPRFDRYREESRAIREILERYSPLIEPLSLDEAFLEVTGSQRLHGPAPAIARNIRETIRRERGLSASVGLAASKFVAKVASDLEKPGGLVVVEPGAEEEFLRPLPVSRMWGVGPVTEQVLARLGIHTIGDLQQASPRQLRPEVGAAAAERLIQLAHGRDFSPVSGSGRAKSLSAETTFVRDLTDRAEMERVLLELVERVGARLRAAGLSARRLTLKVRLADFHTITRSTTLREPTASTDPIYRAVLDLFRHRTDLQGRAVRLLGVAASTGPGRPQQLELFAPAEPSRAERLDRVTDEVRRRLGPEALRRGRLLEGRPRRPTPRPRERPTSSPPSRKGNAASPKGDTL